MRGSDPGHAAGSATTPVGTENKMSSRPNHDWLQGPMSKPLTEFQRFTRDVDWAKSPLGPVEQWPSQLRQLVFIIMADPDPAVVYWHGGDPKDVVIVYNEAYTALIGNKHPDLQGQSPWIGFAEVWDTFDALLRKQLEDGLTSVGEAQRLLFRRHGFLEECYFTWKFIPILGEGGNGEIVGSYATVTERTSEVLVQRRLATVQGLGDELAQASSLDEIWKNIITGLTANEYDVPLAMLYSVQGAQSPAEAVLKSDEQKQDQTCVLEGTLGIERGHMFAPESFDLSCGPPPELAAAFRDASKRRDPLVLRASDGSLPTELFKNIQWRGFGVPCEAAVISAIHNAHGATIGFLLIGLNTYRPYDSPYQDFVRLITEQLATPHVSTVLLREEVEAGRQAANEAALHRLKLDEKLAVSAAAFARSELKFERFADRLPMGVGIIDQDGSVLYSNDAWLRFVGIDRGTKEPFSFMDCVEEEAKPGLWEYWAQVAAGIPINPVVRLKAPWTAPDGQDEPTTVIVSAIPEFDPQGGLTVMSCMTDISELKWVERQLRERTTQVEQNEAKYKRFADLAPVGVCMMDGERLVEFANTSFNDIMAQPVVGKDLLACIHAEDVEKVKQHLSAVSDSASSVTFECRLQRTAALEVKAIPSDNKRANSPTWILASAHQESTPELRTICWVTDITAQKVVEDVLRQRMDEAIEMKRHQEHFIDMTSHEIRNPLSAMIHCADEIIDNCRSQPADLVEHTLEAAQTIEYCAQHIRNIVGDVLTLSKLDSRLVELCPVPARPRDIVQNVLKMFAGELKAADIDVAYVEHPSLDELHVDWLCLDPNRVLQILINLLTNAIKFTRSRPKREIHIRISASLTSPPTHPEGVSYVPPRAAVTPVQFGAPWQQTQSVYLVGMVEDTGSGLTEDERTLLFQRFKQASPKTESKYGGSGLGLFISRNLTELHGGGIGVLAEPDIGSKFVFFIESKRASAPEQVFMPPTPELPPRKRMSSLDIAATVAGAGTENTQPSIVINGFSNGPKPAQRVLVVEDNLINQKVLARQLRKRGFEVSAAINGEEALQMLRDSAAWSLQDLKGCHAAFDVCLMDVEMPVMDGLSCTTAIRAYEREGQMQGHMPIIAVTANVRDELTKAIMQAGVDGITTKPYKIDELIRRIKAVCDTSDAGAGAEQQMP